MPQKRAVSALISFGSMGLGHNIMPARALFAIFGLAKISGEAMKLFRDTYAHATDGNVRDDDNIMH